MPTTWMREKYHAQARQRQIERETRPLPHNWFGRDWTTGTPATEQECDGVMVTVCKPGRHNPNLMPGKKGRVRITSKSNQPHVDMGLSRGNFVSAEHKLCKPSRKGARR